MFKRIEQKGIEKNTLMSYLAISDTQYYRWKDESRCNKWNLRIAFVLILIVFEDVKEAEMWFKWSGNTLLYYESLHIIIMKVLYQVVNGNINDVDERIDFAREYFKKKGFPEFMPYITR